jgi:prevent-host-death family protein
MERVMDVTAARRQFGTLLDEVFHKGDAVTVVRKGKPMARIVPVEPSAAQKEDGISARQKALLEELDSLPALAMDDEPTALLRTMRERKRKQAGKEYGR